MDKIHLYSKARVKGNDLVIGDYIMYDASSEFAQAMSGNTKTKEGEELKREEHALLFVLIRNKMTTLRIQNIKKSYKNKMLLKIFL